MELQALVICGCAAAAIIAALTDALEACCQEWGILFYAAVVALATAMHFIGNDMVGSMLTGWPGAIVLVKLAEVAEFYLGMWTGGMDVTIMRLFMETAGAADDSIPGLQLGLGTGHGPPWLPRAPPLPRPIV